MTRSRIERCATAIATRRRLAWLTGGLLCLQGCENASAPGGYRYVASTASTNADYWWSDEAYPYPLTVRVTAGPSASSAGERGVPVRFALAAGQGRFTDTVVATDANGVATAGPWIVGALGANSVDVAIPSGSDADSLRLRFVTEVFSPHPPTIVEYRLRAEGVGAPQPLRDDQPAGRIWLGDDGTFLLETVLPWTPVWGGQSVGDAIGTYARTDSAVVFALGTSGGVWGPLPNGKLVRDTLFAIGVNCCDANDGYFLVKQVFVKTGSIALARRRKP